MNGVCFPIHAQLLTQSNYALPNLTPSHLRTTHLKLDPLDTLPLYKDGSKQA
jgi:hypothetical protein